MTAGPGKVLVVDDNDAGRYVKRRILEQAGHSVIEAREGFEALRIIVATKPEVVVLDVKLPDIKGTSRAPSFAASCAITVSASVC